MKKHLNTTFAILTVLVFSAIAAEAQFPLKIPKLKIEKPTRESPKSEPNNNGQIQKTNAERQTEQIRDSKNIYQNQRPTNVPYLVKTSIYIQAKTHNEYWKLPKERDYSSWVPVIEFSKFYNNEKPFNYAVEYFHPDGSFWFSEKLSSVASERGVGYASASNSSELLKTKSSAATGVHGFKIINEETTEIFYQGKFKVGKFSTANRPAEKNKFEFYVDHDWLLAFGTIGFHHSDIELGGDPPLVRVWLKGVIKDKELEGRVFYRGQQIASTNDKDGASGASGNFARDTPFAAAYSPLDYWQEWEFQWGRFRFDNNGNFNRSYYPGAHYADRNPGEYAIKIYRNGAQISEMNFAVGADGKFIVPVYAKQIFLPYHAVMLPVKVLGTAEKWNATAWKTDAFYGNPISGFVVP